MSEAQEPQPAALPPASTPAPAATERLRRDIAGLDRLSVLALLVLTFFLSSFVVRNTDYWLHLAAGRLLAEGKVQFGVDPFAYTTGGVYWVNHSWLYDLLLYGFTSLCRGPLGWDGTVVVVLKALAMTLLASVLLSIRRRGVSLWLPVLCTTLAVLAAASRMILGPISVSMLLLGLTLYFLIRDGKPEAGAAKGWRVLLTASPRRLWVLPPLFALWVNLDGWFILGPLLVGLYWLGEALQEALAPERGTADAPAPEERRTLLLVLLVGLAACLLNPHHIWAVTQLPPELFAGQRFPALRDDPRFLLLFLSPFDTRYLSLPVGLNFAGMAYYPLLVLGAISWIASRRWRAWRLLMWFVFALLSASSMLLVPFFALVAGPITALNLQDIAAARRVGKERDADTVALKLGLIGRVLTLLLLVGLTVAAWPGWLHLAPGNPQLERRVAWGVEVEPSLKEVSYKLAYWRMQGWLGPDDRGFNLLPESANAFAWFCPEQKGFIDSRYSLFRHVLGEYEDVRRALLQTPAPTTHEPPADWQAVFRKHGINHVILSGSRSHQSEQALRRMLADADQWTLLYLDGRTAIFGWNDPQRRGSPRFTPLKLDLTTAAFGSSATQAPELGPGRAPRARNAAEKFLTPLPPPSLEMDQAAMLTVYFEGVRQQYLKQREREWRYATGATMVGSLTSLSSVLPSFPIFLWQGLSFDPPNQLYLSYLGDYDMGPPEALLLAVRAARRGAAENPDDLQACRILERATTALALAQENHWARSRARPALSADQLRELREARRPIDAGALPWLTRAVNFRQLLRRIQVLTALHHGLLVEPNDLLAHAQLAELYWSMSFYDLAVEHLREQVRLMRVEEKERSDPQRKAELAQWEQLLSDRERQVNDLQRFAALQLTQAPPRHQPVLAFRYFGLARQALNDLQAQDPTQFNPEEADLLLFLHLMFGQAEQLRGQLTETQQKLLGPLEYEMYRVLQAAAVGDYAEADRALERALGPGTLQPTALPLLNMLQAMTFGQFQPHVVNRRLLAPVLQDQAQVGLRHLMHQRKMKDLEVLRGMLALETGDVDKAKKLFRQAVEQSWGIDFESRPIAMRYLQLLQ